VSEEIILLKGDENESALATHKNIVQNLLMVIAQNCAQCHLKLGQNAEAICACREALEFDSSNIKTLFRLGVAHRALDTSADIERGMKYLKLARSIDPGNIDVQRLLQSMRKEMKLQDKVDRSIYSGLFERGSIEVDRQSVSNNRISSRSSEQSLNILRQRISPEHLKEFDKCIENAKEKQLKAERDKLAHELGIDLNDPRIAQELRRLERKHAQGATVISNSRYRFWGSMWTQQCLNIPLPVCIVMAVFVLVRGWSIWNG